MAVDTLMGEASLAFVASETSYSPLGNLEEYMAVDTSVVVVVGSFEVKNKILGFLRIHLDKMVAGMVESTLKALKQRFVGIPLGSLVVDMAVDTFVVEASFVFACNPMDTIDQHTVEDTLKVP